MRVCLCWCAMYTAGAGRGPHWGILTILDRTPRQFFAWDSSSYNLFAYGPTTHQPEPLASAEKLRAHEDCGFPQKPAEEIIVAAGEHLGG